MPSFTETKITKDNAYEVCKTLFQKGDYVKFYNLYSQALSDAKGSDKDKKTEALDLLDKYNDFIGDLTNPKLINTPLHDEELTDSENIKNEQALANNFYLDVLGYAKFLSKKAVLLLGEQYEDIKQQYENGEIPGAELMADDPKAPAKMAAMTAKYNTDAGKEADAHATIVTALFTAANRKNKNRKDIEHEANDDAEKMIPDARYPKNKRGEHYKIFAGLTDTFFLDKCSLKGDTTFTHRGSSKENLDKGIMPPSIDTKENHTAGDYFDSIPSNITKITSMSSEELENYKTELEGDKKVLQIYENAADNWAKTAKSLAAELENLPENVKSSKEFAGLKRSLENAGKIGTAFDYFSKNNKKRKANILENNMEVSNTSLNYNPEAIDYTFEETNAWMDELASKYPETADFVKKAKSASLNENEKIRAAFKKGADKLFEAGKYDLAVTESKLVDKMIKRIEKQQPITNIKTMVPKKAKALEKMQQMVRDYDNKKALARKISSKVDNVIDTLKINNTFFAKDKKERGNLFTFWGLRHNEYNKLTDQTDALSKIDSRNTSLSEIIETFTKTRDAADKYVKTHEGAKNFTSGWSDEARERIDNAKELRDQLDAFLKEIKPECDKLGDSIKKDDSIKKFLNRMDRNKKHVRSVILDKRAIYDALADNLKETPPEKEKYDRVRTTYSYDWLVKKANDTIKNQADKNEMKKGLASIMAADYIKQKQHGNNILNITAADFAVVARRMMKDPAFKKVFDSNSAEQLKELASNKGEGFLNAVNNAKKASAQKSPTI